ncbi:MAG TPA: dihydrodiol dehydrogenase [Chloroflexota bacterium]|nr:dihydrodiol dehydrogenase [Chloroflexota bacterium]
MREEQPAASAPLVIANEFATVTIEKVATRNGERLRISSPRLNTSIELDALALESLTWQPPETFSRFLEQPFGDADSG